jgi:Serine dehydrogenase proteinase
VPGWQEILAEVHRSGQQRGALGPDLDGIRQRYLTQLSGLAGRAVIIYASAWLQKPAEANVRFSVEGDDIHGLIEVCNGLDNHSQLDLILHSPGGSPQAAEQMVEYLRTRFSYIRAIVPLQAKSAATMVALGCDEIVMADHSELGPIDPQILVPVPEGNRFAPAHAILRDFERAKTECEQNVNSIVAWTPILRSYAGGLIEFCTQQIALSMELVENWLDRYLLLSHAEGDRRERARAVARYFGSDEAYDRYRTHARPIRTPELQGLGLRVTRLEEDPRLREAVLSIYHAVDITFNTAPVIKLMENHVGRRKIQSEQQIIFTQQVGPPSTPGVAKQKPLSRQQRRQLQRKGG